MRLSDKPAHIKPVDRKSAFKKVEGRIYVRPTMRTDAILRQVHALPIRQFARE